MTLQTDPSHALALKALYAVSSFFITDAHRERIARGDLDISFDEFGMDSLSRMELSIWLELELGIELTENEIQDMQSLDKFAAFLAQHAI
jgi:acyl carrier protein